MEKKNIQQVKRSFVTRAGVIDVVVRGPRDIDCHGLWSSQTLKPRYDPNTYYAITNDLTLIGVIEALIPILSKVSTLDTEVKREEISKIVTYLESILSYKRTIHDLEISFLGLPKEFNREQKQFEMIEYTESPYVHFKEWINIIWSNIQHLIEENHILDVESKRI